MIEKEVHEKIFSAMKSHLGENFVLNRSSDILPSVEIHPEKIRAGVEYLKNSFHADFLESMDAADLYNYKGDLYDPSRAPWHSLYTEDFNQFSESESPRLFLLQYQLFSFNSGSHYILKTVLPFKNLSVESIDDLYGNANWHEREIWDLLGIDFIHSKDLSRLLLPENWEGHPLRRDYEQKDNYNGMSTQRVSELQNYTNRAVKNIETWRAVIESRNQTNS